jgi:threonine dehydratase
LAQGLGARRGAGRNRTGEWEFCRLLPYHLATAPRDSQANWRDCLLSSCRTLVLSYFVPTQTTLVSLADIRSARNVHGDRLVRTPLVASAALSQQTGARVSLKLELFQHTGSFKPRGVLNVLESLAAEERSRGVISISAGNHAQALAWAATAIGVQSTIVMPATAVKAKVDATRAFGGEVIQTAEDLLATMRQVQEERSLVFVHPFDDPVVIAGAGTLGLEIAEDAPDVDMVIAGCGGGGLLSGVAAAMHAVRPHARVFGVEPTGADAMSQSLAKGEPVRLAKIDTIADGLAPPFAGVHTLAHVRAFVSEVVTIDDSEILDAMRVLMKRARILPEPAAAAATAALLDGRFMIRPGEHVVVVVSGGNADPALLRTLL